MNVGQRLRNLREILGLSQDVFAKQLNITQGALSHYEKNRILMSLPVAFSIYAQTKCNIHWLLTGDGDMFIDNTKNINFETNLLCDSTRDNYIKELESKVSELKKNVEILEKDNSDLDRKTDDLKQELLDKMNRLIALQDKLLSYSH